MKSPTLEFIDKYGDQKINMSVTELVTIFETSSEALLAKKAREYTVIDHCIFMAGVFTALQVYCEHREDFDATLEKARKEVEEASHGADGLKALIDLLSKHEEVIH